MMSSKWLLAILAVSLVANLLMVGYFLGQSSQPRFSGDPTRMFPRWVRTLPESRQDILRPMVREHIRTVRQPLRDMRHQHEALHNAIRAEPFDAPALANVLAQLREQNEQVQQASHQAFVKFVAALNPDERQALISDLRAPKPRRWHPPRHPQ